MNNTVGINIFGYESGEGLFPLILSELSARVIDLLLISEAEKKHYCTWIKNVDKLLAVRTEKSTHSVHHCARCFTGYQKVDSLNEHNEYCSFHDAVRNKKARTG